MKSMNGRARWHEAPVGRHCVDARERHGMVGEDDLQTARAQVIAAVPDREQRDAEPCQRSLANGFTLAALQRALHFDGDLAAARRD